MTLLPQLDAAWQRCTDEILIADDELISRRLLQKTLERAATSDRCGERPPAAEQCAQQKDPGLLSWTG